MVLELLAALCLVGEEYHKYVLLLWWSRTDVRLILRDLIILRMVIASLEHYREVYRERKPYVTLVDYLRENTHHTVKVRMFVTLSPNLNLMVIQAASLGLINSLINCTEDMTERVNLRDHFKTLDLIKVLRVCQAYETLQQAFNNRLGVAQDSYQ